jgi:hypothetical protein
MPDTLLLSRGSASPASWVGDLTRVPYWVYRDGALPKVEQERLFEGPPSGCPAVVEAPEGRPV